MRVLLFTGKGGVGKTTVAAATATLAAERGLATLVVSTDAAHSLGDALGLPVGADPTPVATRLHAQQVDAQQRFEHTWCEVQSYLRTVLDSVGVDPLAAEELTVLPGAEEVMALLEVRAQLLSGRWDLVVVDCAPTGETLRLLALPEALGWYMDRIFPVERRVVRSLRPVLGRVAGVPMPHDRVFAAVERLHGELAEVRRLLADPALSSVRLVLTPEAVVVAEARRTLTALALHGYPVDAVVANRVMPGDGDDGWRAGWAAAQRRQLAEVDASFAPLPVLRAAYLPAEPVGVAQLAPFAATTYGALDPFAPATTTGGPQVQRDGDEFELVLSLPYAERDTVELARSGDDLVVTVDGRRRLLCLPSALRRCDAAGAQLSDGELRVRFRPDPAVWMRT